MLTLRTTTMSSGAARAWAISSATGTPPRGSPRTKRPWFPRSVPSRAASTRPACLRSSYGSIINGPVGTVEFSGAVDRRIRRRTPLEWRLGRGRSGTRRLSYPSGSVVMHRRSPHSSKTGGSKQDACDGVFLVLEHLRGDRSASGPDHIEHVACLGSVRRQVGRPDLAPAVSNRTAYRPDESAAVLSPDLDH